jgi:titin
MGVQILGNDTSGNIVSGNYIGTDASGTVDLGNWQCGVRVGDGAHDNIIGGDTPAERNVISGSGGYNLMNGVYISGAAGNVVSGNYIGTDASGAVALGNGERGVYIRSAQNNIIGGDTPGERNVISGNGFSGVEVGGGAMGNTVSGNYIGTDASGTVALGNGYGNGVRLYSDAENNTVGGDTPGERNVISGNDYSGVLLLGDSYGDPRGNIVSGNYIGTDATGSAALGNDGNGVQISEDAQDNTIGPDNVIAYNIYGVSVYGSDTTGNTITQNSIYANDELGIVLANGANGDIAAPIIATTIGMFNVLGTACPGCTVEIFENSDTDGEGESYVGEAIADADGDFVVTVGTLTDPYLTATATGMVNGTSEFSAVFVVSRRIRVYLPLVLNSH